MSIEKRYNKVAAVDEAIERWQKKLFRASNELQKLLKERKRLLSPPRGKKIANRKLEDIPHMLGGGDDFHSDDIPI